MNEDLPSSILARAHKIVTFFVTNGYVPGEEETPLTRSAVIESNNIVSHIYNLREGNSGVPWEQFLRDAMHGVEGSDPVPYLANVVFLQRVLKKEASLRSSLEWMNELYRSAGTLPLDMTPSRDDVSKSVREEVKVGDGDLCRYCMKNAADTIDHVIPVARGGSSRPVNLVACCQRCNVKKGSKTPREAGMVLHLTTRFFGYDPWLI